MFDGVKKMFGSSSSNMPKNGGHVLGGSTPEAPPPPQPQRNTFDVTFAAKSMGMTMKPGVNQEPVVSKVTPNSEASRAGVRANDLVVRLEGNDVTNYDDFLSVVTSLGRPIRLTFSRIQPPPSQPAPTSSSSKKPAVLSDEELQQRRETARKAAESRGQAWDKKIASSRNARLQQTQSKGVTDVNVSMTKEGEAAFNNAKSREANTVNQLGYNPYQPIFGSSTQTKAAIDQAAESHITQAPQLPSQAMNSRFPAPNDGNRMTPGSYQPEDELGDDLAHAMALLASHPTDVMLKCATTISKILSNLQEHFDDEKFHKVRTENKAIKEKVLSVSGGLEILMEAGFQLSHDESGESVLVYPMERSPVLGVALRSLATLVESSSN